MRNIKNTLRTVFILAFSAILLSWSSPGSAGAEKLRITLNFLPYGLHLGFFVAKAKGFYKEVGFDEVEIVRGHGSGDAVKRVGIREFDVGFADHMSLVRGHNKGLNVIGVGIVLDRGPAVLYSLDKSGIRTLKDSTGKRVGALQASAIRGILEATMAFNKLNPKSIQWLSMPGSAYVGSLVKGRVDAIATYATTRPNYIKAAAEYSKNMPPAQKAGYKVNEIWLADYGVDIYGAGLIANGDVLKKNPGMVKRYVQATMKGYAWAVEHPEEAVDIFVKTHPEVSASSVRVQFAVTVKSLMTSTAKKLGIGHYTKEKMAKTREQGLLGISVSPNIPPVEKMYTNEFLLKLFPKEHPLIDKWFKN